MTQRTRRILYLSFILIFLIIAPLLMMHTAGYRYDWSRKQIIKTGVLTVKSMPSGASVFLNNNNTYQKTPATISNIYPGTYNIKLEKDGYLSWEGVLAIDNDSASNIENLVLFPNLSNEILSSLAFTQTLEIPDQDKVLAITANDAGQTLTLLDLATGKISSLRENEPAISIDSVVDDNKAIISIQSAGQNSHMMVYFDTPEKSEELNWLNEELSAISPINDTAILALSEQKLCRFSLIEANKFCDGQIISSYFQKDNKIYYFTEDEKTSYLYSTSPADLLDSRLIARLPSSADYRLITVPGNNLLVVDQSSNKLFFIEQTEPQSRITEFSNPAKDAFWLTQDKELIYYNDFEIWSWRTDNNQHKLINRVSEAIGRMVRLDNLPYVIYSQNNKIQALELESYGNIRRVVTLAENLDTWFTLSRNYENIYYLDSSGRFWKRLLN